ncbi:hypothetical protein [Vibrio sp. 10N.239.312.D08]|uniref:hypothetical protein n=1 Tax=Vibrio sp. 10N.239.312.D08 TaxID=3229978 RepID=UPI00354F66C1
MTVVVRCSYRGEQTLIGEDGIITGKGVQGAKLARALPFGNISLHDFGGVMDHSAPCKGALKVKICFVTGFQWSLNESMHEIPRDSFTLGYLLNENLYVAIKENEPMHWPIPMTVA